MPTLEVAIGPEGGWSPEEEALFDAKRLARRIPWSTHPAGGDCSYRGAGRSCFVS